jgi:hypothetical protein
LGKPVILQDARSSIPDKTNLRAPAYAPQGAADETTRSGKLQLRGKAYTYTSAKDDPSFLERCSRHPDAQGRKRRYIARTPEELYPDREDLRDMRESLPGGWLVATNLNNILKKAIIKLATEIAGLTFGKDVVVEF